MNINVTYPDTRNVNYTYDEAGNRTSMVETEKTGATPVTTTYQYNEVNEMMSLVKGNDTTNYTYDQDGNTLTKANTAGTTYYHWNLKGELAATELPGNKSNVMEYDMNGMRIRYTTADNVTTNYVYEGLGTVMEIVGTRVTKKYYSGISMVIPENPGKSCKQTYYYLYDGLGDVVNLTDEAGNLVQTYYFDAFGKSTNVKHDCVNKKQFTGKEIDEDSGLHYFGARYYDAEVGRFISEDSNPNTNPYVYCSNDPTNKFDPDGRKERPVESDINFVRKMLPYAQAAEKTTHIKADLTLTIWYHESGAGSNNLSDVHNYGSLGYEGHFSKFSSDSDFLNSDRKGNEGWISYFKQFENGWGKVGDYYGKANEAGRLGTEDYFDYMGKAGYSNEQGWLNGTKSESERSDYYGLMQSSHKDVLNYIGIIQQEDEYKGIVNDCFTGP